MSKVRVAFLGTPAFAVSCLRSLLKDEHFEIVGVVTQPDRPQGRKLQLTPSLVKAFAAENGLKVISPEKINKDESLDEVRQWGAEVAVVVAFGQILSQKFLDLFPLGAVNVHASLLPKWRGAAPIQRSIEAGDTETGVALQKIVKELDAGDVLGVRKVSVDDQVTALELHDQLAKLGAETLHVELMDYVRGNLVPVPQDHSLATYARKIEKAECLIDWNQPASKIHNQVRAFTMGPGARTLLNGRIFKVHRTRVVEMAKNHSQAGTLRIEAGHQLFVECGSGRIEILEIQPESKARMPAAELVKGGILREGERFSSADKEGS